MVVIAIVYNYYNQTKNSRMKFLLTTLFVFVMLTGGLAQKHIKLSDEILNKDFTYTNFDALDVASDFNVTINFSNGPSTIKVTANENLMDQVSVTKTGNTLVLRLKNNLWLKGHVVLDVYITAPMIDEYKVASDAAVILKNPLITSTVRMDLRGDSVFKGTLEAEKLELTARSDSELYLQGTIRTMTATLSGDSELKAKALVVQDLKIELNGDSDTRITVQNTLDACARGDSDLYYKGNPKIIYKKVRGDSDITQIR